MGREREYSPILDDPADEFTKWYVIRIIIAVGIGLAFMVLSILGISATASRLAENPPILDIP